MLIPLPVFSVTGFIDELDAKLMLDGTSIANLRMSSSQKHTGLKSFSLYWLGDMDVGNIMKPETSPGL